MRTAVTRRRRPRAEDVLRDVLQRVESSVAFWEQRFPTHVARGALGELYSLTTYIADRAVDGGWYELAQIASTVRGRISAAKRKSE